MLALVDFRRSCLRSCSSACRSPSAWASPRCCFSSVWTSAQNLTMVAQRMYSSTTGFTLLAIPFFIMAGNLMNTGGVTTRIFRFASALRRAHLWGGLGAGGHRGRGDHVRHVRRGGGRGRRARHAGDEGHARARVRPAVHRRHHGRGRHHRAGHPAEHSLRHLRQHHRRVHRPALSGRIPAWLPDGHRHGDLRSTSSPSAAATPASRGPRFGEIFIASRKRSGR